MNFKKYNSIENSYQKAVVEQIYLHEFDNETFVVQEKVHGANFSFITNGKTIACAKRSGIIAKNEAFFNYETVLEKYKTSIIALFGLLKAEYIGLQTLTIFGELFGGFYDHPNVPIKKGMVKVQRGIDYAPENDFYAFDILLNHSTFLDVETSNAWFDKMGFFYAKTLFKGELKQALNHPNLFNSLIPKWKELPNLQNNICEGVIIKPVKPLFFGNGKRVILKNKNDRWAEKVKLEKAKIASAPLTKNAQKVLTEIQCYVNANRLNNVLSKEGEFKPSLIGKLIGLLVKDVYADFLKEHNTLWNLLEKNEQKKINKCLNKQAVTLIKTELMGVPV